MTNITFDGVRVLGAESERKASYHTCTGSYTWERPRKNTCTGIFRYHTCTDIRRWFWSTQCIYVSRLSIIIGESLSLTPIWFRAILYLEQYYGNGNRGEIIAPIFVAEKMCNEVQKQVFFASLALLYLVDGKFGNVSKLAFSLQSLASRSAFLLILYLWSWIQTLLCQVLQAVWL